MPRAAFTIIELLVVIGITTLLIGLTAPSLRLARERGRLAVCLANAQSINSAMTMYLSDDGRNLPWFYIYGVDAAGDYLYYPGATTFSTFSYGGMLPAFSHGAIDSQMTPVELRPFNRYIAPDACGFEVVKVYVCPSDRSAANPGFMSGPASASSDPDNGTPNWREYGTSYSISWHWLRSYRQEEPDLTDVSKRLMEFGARMLHDVRGGGASTFVWMSENHLDQMLNAAADGEGGRPGIQGPGWHGSYSVHTALFLDGHAENRHFDTRFIQGSGWTAVVP